MFLYFCTHWFHICSLIDNKQTESCRWRYVHRWRHNFHALFLLSQLLSLSFLKWHNFSSLVPGTYETCGDRSTSTRRRGSRAPSTSICHFGDPRVRIQWCRVRIKFTFCLRPAWRGNRVDVDLHFVSGQRGEAIESMSVWNNISLPCPCSDGAFSYRQEACRGRCAPK